MPLSFTVTVFCSFHLHIFSRFLGFCPSWYLCQSTKITFGSKFTAGRTLSVWCCQRWLWGLSSCLCSKVSSTNTECSHTTLQGDFRRGLCESVLLRVPKLPHRSRLVHMAGSAAHTASTRHTPHTHQQWKMHFHTWNRLLQLPMPPVGHESNSSSARGSREDGNSLIPDPISDCILLFPGSKPWAMHRAQQCPGNCCHESSSAPMDSTGTPQCPGTAHRGALGVPLPSWACPHPIIYPGTARCHHRPWAHLLLCFQARPEQQNDGNTAGKSFRALRAAQSPSQMAPILLNVQKSFQLERRILKSKFQNFWWNGKITHSNSTQDESQAHFPLSYFASSMSHFLLLLWHLPLW